VRRTIPVRPPQGIDGARTEAVSIAFPPGEDASLNTHCSVPQHEQKGMRMTVVVGAGGDGDGVDH
jgi:hypothetical protein